MAEIHEVLNPALPELIRLPCVGAPEASQEFGSDGERLLRGFLGEVEVAEEADQGGQDAAPFRAEDLFERCYFQYTSEGRISTAPP